jgi:hypothetical protein
VLVNIIKSLRKYVSIRLCNCLEKSNDETLPNFIKRKHPRKGEKKKQGARTKDQGPRTRQANSPKEVGHKEEKEPLRTEPFKINLFVKFEESTFRLKKKRNLLNFTILVIKNISHPQNG